MMGAYWRKFLSTAFVLFCGASVLLALVPLAFILFFVGQSRSAGTQLGILHEHASTGGGGRWRNGQRDRWHADAGRPGLASCIPVGIMSGVYMAEYAGSRMASAIRFAADTLNGVPSIVVGVFVYGIAVLPFKQFSALAAVSRSVS